MKYSVTILGAGAAGLMCAITAARRGRKVVVVDHNKDVGSKINVSGGGRCNFTNLNSGSEYYVSENPHFVKSALSRFTPRDFLKILDDHKIPYLEKKDGQLFCERSSRDILGLLKKECLELGVKILANTKIKSVEFNDSFRIKTSHLDLESESVVVATGGLSYPSLGASDLGFRVARQFKLKVTNLWPALVPLLFDGRDRKIFSQLSGVSFRGTVSCEGVKFTDDILFTHKGLSGPAILQISSYWQKGKPIVINVLPGVDLFLDIIKKKKESGKSLLKNYLSGFISKRFAELWCRNEGLSKNLAAYSEKDLKKICAGLHSWKIVPAGTEGYKKAEATRGGVDTAEISSKTMESKRVKGLYFIGEVLDVVGHLGGFNLHWAWASGHAAGTYA